jgi:hypothetical protein
LSFVNAVIEKKHASAWKSRYEQLLCALRADQAGHAENSGRKAHGDET